MTGLQHKICSARRRLWVRQALEHVSLSLAAATVLMTLLVFLKRGWDLPWPVSPVVVALALVAILVGLITATVRRASAATAASILDETAGLKERLSSGLYCGASGDPFARAVVDDAERTSGGLEVRRLIRIRWPRGGRWIVAGGIPAAAAFLIPPGAFLTAEVKATQKSSVEIVETQKTVERKLADLRNKLGDLGALAPGAMSADPLEPGVVNRPSTTEGISHEAVKKIDQLQDVLKRRQAGVDYAGARDLKRMMRALHEPPGGESSVQKLSRSLQKGDFRAAQREIAALKEQLARLKSEGTNDGADELKSQLDSLSAQLAQLATKDQTLRKLAAAGLSPEQLERLLERLQSKDLEEVRNLLKGKGLSDQQIEQLLKQLEKSQRGGKLAQELARSLQRAGSSAGDADLGDAFEGLSDAEGQLSELEMLEQQFNELEAALAETEEARSAMTTMCPACQGQGQCQGRPCGTCGGTGSCGRGPGMRGPGQGQGGKAEEEVTGVDFEKKKVKVPMGRGAIIGRTSVDGEQVAGESHAQPLEVIIAGERDAADRIDRDRIPRQYQQAVREYFSNMRGRLDPKAASEPPVESASPPMKPAPSAEQ